MSRAIIDGVGSTREVDRLREQWSRQTRNGLDASAIDDEVQMFQNAVQRIAELREPYDSYKFYVPGGSGMIRVLIYIDKERRPKATLVDDAGIRRVRENFEKLF